MQPDTVKQPLKFQRTKNIPIHLIPLLFAIIPWLFHASLIGHIGVSLAIGLALLIPLVLYMLPVIEFPPDGSIKQYVNKVQPSEVTKVQYKVFQFEGLRGQFSVRTVGIFTGDGLGATGVLIPKITVPTTGWRTEERQMLFTQLREWLVKTNADIDPKTKQLLSELAQT